MTTVIFIIATIYCVLNIILFFKIWGATNDIKRIKNIMVSNWQPLEETVSNQSSPLVLAINHDEIPKFAGFLQTSNSEVSYNLYENGMVEFSDGNKGCIKEYPGYNECSVLTNHGFELLYEDRDTALYALYTLCTTGKESGRKLLRKRPYKD